MNEADEVTSFFREEREALKLTQQDAAVLIGVTRVTYNKWENEPETMPLGKYAKLVREFRRLRALKENEE